MQIKGTLHITKNGLDKTEMWLTRVMLFMGVISPVASHNEDAIGSVSFGDEENSGAYNV